MLTGFGGLAYEDEFEYMEISDLSEQDWKEIFLRRNEAAKSLSHRVLCELITPEKIICHFETEGSRLIKSVKPLNIPPLNFDEFLKNFEEPDLAQ